jgi:Leucine-rich repeat (LRR) protein
VEALDLDFALSEAYDPAPLKQVAGLAGFVNLRKLALPRHELRSLEGLPGLTALQQLDLSFNQLEDLAALPLLPALEVLDLSYNLLPALPAADRLPRLQRLHFGHNNLRHLSGIDGFASLQSLVLSGNRRCRDLTPLRPLSGLHTLFAKGLFVTDWSAVASLSQLQVLALTPTSSESLTPWQGHPSLKTAYFSLSRLSGRFSLPALPHLQQLSLIRGQAVTAITGLPQAPQLTTLNLAHNALESLPDLQGLDQLTTLDLRFNRLQNVDALAELPALQLVDLEGNPPLDLSPLRQARPELEIRG